MCVIKILIPLFVYSYLALRLKVLFALSIFLYIYHIIIIVMKFENKIFYTADIKVVNAIDTLQS